LIDVSQSPSFGLEHRRHLSFLVEPDGVGDIYKGVDTAIVHCLLPKDTGLREVPHGAASIVLKVHGVNIRSEIKLAGIVHPGPKLQVAGFFLVVMLTDSLEHHGRNPTDVPVVLNHQVRPAAHQVLSKMAGDIIEEEDVRRPKLVWRKLDLGDALIVRWVPLQVLVHPLEVKPHQRGQYAPLIVVFHNLF